jgi:hypothetical protein
MRSDTWTQGDQQGVRGGLYGRAYIRVVLLCVQNLVRPLVPGEQLQGFKRCQHTRTHTGTPSVQQSAMKPTCGCHATGREPGGGGVEGGPDKTNE